MVYHGKHLSIRNKRHPDKPNEDHCICDNKNGIFIMLDGVSRDIIGGMYPNPSPSLQVSKLFAINTHKYMLSALDSGTNDFLTVIKGAMRFGNGCIADFNSKNEYSFLPGTVGIVLLIRDNMAFYGFIGDCIGKIVSINKTTVFTRCQTKYVHEHKGEFNTHEIRNIICNNSEHPAGYGVINGQLAALDFIEFGSFELLEGNKIMLYTDGFESILNSLSAIHQFELTIDEAKNFANKQINKFADDKTILIISY